MNKYSRIILHVGLSKTGSTSMQDNCALHRQFLAQRGVVYPQFDFEGEAFSNHSIVVTGAITQEPGRYGLRLPQRFPGREQDVLQACASQLSELLSNGVGQTLVLSTELIENFGPEDAGVLRDQLAAATDELRVVAFVRSPVDSLTSLLQERVKAGINVSPEKLAGRVRAKCDRIQQHFGELAQFENYHDAAMHPDGLVGAWFELLGIDRGALTQLELVDRNASLSQEAYTLMRAVNHAYPMSEQAVHNVPRFPYDLDVLMQLPGQRFMLPGLRDSAAYQVCLGETVWLQDALGLAFPEDIQEVQGELWQTETIAALENLVGKIEHPALRNTIAGELAVQSDQLCQARPADAARLQDIANVLRLAD
ncbi:MAG: hypothetical protein ACI9NT_001612 [Bacteroidia bacterium]|jgi:hypothetical protein